MKALAAFAIIFSLAIAYPAFGCDDKKKEDKDDKTPQSSSLIQGSGLNHIL